MISHPVHHHDKSIVWIFIFRNICERNILYNKKHRATSKLALDAFIVRDCSQSVLFKLLLLFTQLFDYFPDFFPALLGLRRKRDDRSPRLDI